MYIDEELIFYNVSLENQDQLFDWMANELEKKDYVTKDFRDAIKKREQEFPTGLQLNGLNVSIPHADAKYAKNRKLVIIKPENSITFKNMLDFEPIEVDIVFGLIVDDHKQHLEILQKVSQLLRKQEVIQEIKAVHSKSELLSLMQKHFIN